METRSNIISFLLVKEGANMTAQKIFSALVVITLLIFTQALSYGNDHANKAVRYYAHMAKWLESVNNSVGQNKYDMKGSQKEAHAAELNESGGAASAIDPFVAPAVAVTSMYPLYDMEYFYRTSSNGPIRDFRSYDVKTIIPEADYYGVVKHTKPIRDFRDYRASENR